MTDVTVSEDPAVQIIADALAASWATDQAADVNVDAEAVAAALRAAGYPLNPDEVSVPIGALRELVTVARYVSRGRRAVDVGTYPDATARYALGGLPDDLLARLDPSTKENA